MIEAGWYYCPTLESDDFVQCAYCGLSLDGWEPKDNPRYVEALQGMWLTWAILTLMPNSTEHQRRSPDCTFFSLSNATKPKAGRSRKGRASKASRMSTQSNITAFSEGTSIPQIEANGDDSMLCNVDIVKATKAGKAAKKSVKHKRSRTQPKTRASKTREEDAQVASSFLEPEDDDFGGKVDNFPAARTRNKKRKSDEMSAVDDVLINVEAHREDGASREPATKRRATRTRGSMAQNPVAPDSPLHEGSGRDIQMADVETMPLPQPALAPQRKGNKKRSSSRVREASMTSTASKASLRATLLHDEDIDAALEADLNRPLTDDEIDTAPSEKEQPKSRRLIRTKHGSRKAAASVAPTRRATRASTVAEIHLPLSNAPDVNRTTVSEEVENIVLVHDSPGATSKANNSKRTDTRKALAQQKARNDQEVERSEETDPVDIDHINEGETPTIASPQPRSNHESEQLSVTSPRAENSSNAQDVKDVTNSLNYPVLDIQTTQDDSGHETDASTMKQGSVRSSGKQASRAAKKTKGGKKPKNNIVTNSNIEPEIKPIMKDGKPESMDSHQNTMAANGSKSVDAGATELELIPEQTKAPEAVAKPTRTKKANSKMKPTPRIASASAPTEKPGLVVDPRIPTPSPQAPSVRSTPKPDLSRQSSDVENQPPSSRTSVLRPLLSLQSPLRPKSACVALEATTPISSPSRGNLAKLQSAVRWTAIDLEQIFQGTPTADKENDPSAFGQLGKEGKNALTSPEKKLTVEQWIQFNAQRGEEKLRNECERLVGKFEDQGVRALRVLEGIACAE